MTEKVLCKYANSLAHLIRLRRAYFNMSLRQLSKETGVSVTKLCKLEQCNYDPRLSEIEKIYDVLELNLNY